MAQPATNPKIEELRLKLKADPKSRLFYQLAEELRKTGQPDEAEKVLRAGLSVYPTYLAAWVSFGRVLRDQKDEAGAVEALNKALQLDPGNVVAARLLGDAYYALGEKVEAIKKYKLVHALLPADEGLEAQIAMIEREMAEPSPALPLPEPAIEASIPVSEPSPDAGATPFPSEELSFSQAAPEPPAFTPSPFLDDESPFDKTVPPFRDAAQRMEEEVHAADETGDSEPMSLSHQESPFEEPSGFTEASLEIESPAGVHLGAAPATAEVPAPAVENMPSIEAQPLLESLSAPDAGEELFERPFEGPADLPPPVSDAADTVTMADLYAKQGLVEDARHIYENILHRDPENAGVRAKLDDIAPRVNPKIAKLEDWLARVSRREVGRV
jgi:tetratricopeptide (TPR) repeat protein